MLLKEKLLLIYTTNYRELRFIKITTLNFNKYYRNRN
jgi:hypothetical protein